MRALLSVTDKTGVADLAHGLDSLGIELVSTGGTAKAIADAGVPVTQVADFTGFPEMMDGRLKTLHPNVLGGILARRAPHQDATDAAIHSIEMVDIVVVNLYRFEETARRPDVTFDELVENVDIGGPTMIRAAAKNWRHVVVVVDPSDYDPLLAELGSRRREWQRTGRPASTATGEEFRLRLMQKAFSHTAAYDGVIASTLGQYLMGESKEIERLVET